MIKTIFKLVIVAIVLNALFRTGVVAWDYYQLRDEAEQIIVFGASAATTDLHNQILIKARELQVPLQAENLTVRREGQRTFVEARYTQPVEYFPNQTYPADLSFAVDSFTMAAIAPESSR